MEPVLFLENPSNRKFYQWGSNVDLLKKFIYFLDKEADNISEIYLSMRLYNNGVLHEKMKAFANRGIKVTVISIPLEGYDDGHSKDIYEYGTNESYLHNVTIYSLAKNIYEDIERLNNENYILWIFDHTYVRKVEVRYHSTKKTLPYSLYTNSIYIKYKDGKTVTGLISSNLAVGDRPKDELMLLVEDTQASREMTEMFFTSLLEHSVRLSDWKNSYPNYHYEMETVDVGSVGMNYFTAPFIQDSPIKIEEKLIDIISSAQKRIYICAEQLSAFSYRGIRGNRLGIFGAIFEKCRQGVEVKCLSRTYMDTDGDSHGQRKPKDEQYFKKLIQQVDQLGSCSYRVNKNVNAKFIVVDNIIIVGTGDYTPSEFTYGDVSIDNSDTLNMRGISYRGKYSRVNHYIIMEDGGLAGQLIGFFNKIIARSDTYVHEKATVGKNATGTWNGTEIRRKELLMMDDRAFIDRILAFPDSEILNLDEDGRHRKYPLAEMADRVKKQMERDPDYRISTKQKFAMASSFVGYSSKKLKVSGTKSARIDPNTLVKEEIEREGVKTVYSMKFHLQPEPNSQLDKNAVAVYVDNIEGGRSRIGYVPQDYIEAHPITNLRNVNGTLTDYSNGKLNNVSYAFVIGYVIMK